MQAKTREKDKKQNGNKKIVIVGCCILAVAVLIVLGIVFIPDLVQESNMEDHLIALAAEDAQSVVLIDPLPVGGNLLTDSAVQLELTGEALALVRSGLAELAEQGFDAAGEITQKNLNDLVLRVRTADGRVLQLYLSVGKFYYYADSLTVAISFTPKDTAAYSAFYQSLEALVAKE